MLGVKRNLWATQQSGLYAPKRMNFPLDSLELYLPLGHPELSGSPIVSKDLNAHSCTVIGAVHVPPTHRAVDATDDKITVPDAASITAIFGLAMLPMALILLLMNFLLAQGKIRFVGFMAVATIIEIAGIHFYRDNLHSVLYVIMAAACVALFPMAFSAFWQYRKQR